jgi:hypothetical protein
MKRSFYLTRERLTTMGLADFMEPCILTPSDQTGCAGVKHVRLSAQGQWTSV